MQNLQRKVKERRCLTIEPRSSSKLSWSAAIGWPQTAPAFPVVCRGHATLNLRESIGVANFFLDEDAVGAWSGTQI